MKAIVEGWTNHLLIQLGFKSIPDHAKRRAEVCSGCDKNKKNICSECGCYIPAKTLVTGEYCPLDKWQQ